jgi:hypothetical protein
MNYSKLSAPNGFSITLEMLLSREHFCQNHKVLELKHSFGFSNLFHHEEKIMLAVDDASSEMEWREKNLPFNRQFDNFVRF